MQLGSLLATMFASGTIVATLSKSITTFLSSRRTDARITVKVGDREVTLDADNVDDAHRLIRLVLDAPEGEEATKP